jgi:hypothetical protein
MLSYLRQEMALRWTHTILRRFLKPTGDRLGIPGVTFQSLRRTFATLVQTSGTVKDAQTQLRHADAQTTMNIYQKAIPASVASAVEGLERKLEQAERKSRKGLTANNDDVDSASSSATRTNSRGPRSGKGPTPNAQLLHNFSKGGFSTVTGTALNRRSWVVRPRGFEPLTFCSGGKRSIRTELRAHSIHCSSTDRLTKSSSRAFLPWRVWRLRPQALLTGSRSFFA